jgi:uncharacterized membrane protein SpoIIM required for sporulation
MAEPRLKSSRFRAEREPDWRRLEALLSRVEKGSAAALSVDELIAAPVLYRAALSSLSVARATSLDQSLIDYLESLSARAYFLIYGSRVTALERAARFFVHDWPAAARSIWRETAFCLALTLLGTLVAYMLVMRDPSWYAAFMPAGMAAGRDPAATTAALKATLFDDNHKQALSFFATFLFTHNAGVALLAFALGFAFGVPTALLEVQNGCMLGAIFALFVSHHLGFELGGWLFIHGVTELGAIMLAGGAGMRIGWALAFPGRRARLTAAAEEGRRAATLMAGVVVMLLFAGLLEGIGRQLIQVTAIRYAIAIGSGVIWLTYLYLPRGPRSSDGLAGAREAALG